LVATTSSNANSGIDSEDEDEVYSKLTRSELVDSIKELISHYQTKSKELNFLKEMYVRLIREHERTHLEMENLEDENRCFKKMTDKWSNNPQVTKILHFKNLL
jgi:regulator of replication initiation timing